MTRDNPFDFNDVYVPFGRLGQSVGIAVQDALAMFEISQDKFDRSGAALRASRLLLAALAQDSELGPKDTVALIDILDELNEAAKVIKESQPKKVGRPSGSAIFERQAHAVIAIDWLQNLRAGAQDRETALKAVAGCIPSDMFQPKPGGYGSTLAPIAQLEAWLEAFGRKRNSGQRQALANVRGGLFDEFYRCWREPVRELPDGAIEYSEEWREHDHLDISPAGVIEWLRRGLAEDD